MPEAYYFVTIEVTASGLTETVQKAISFHPFIYYFRVRDQYKNEKVEVVLRSYRKIDKDEHKLWNELLLNKKEKADG